MLKLGNICSNFPSSSSRTGRWLSGCFLRSRRDETRIKVETRAGSHLVLAIISPVNILYFVWCTVLLWYYWCQITNICVVVVDTTPPQHTTTTLQTGQYSIISHSAAASTLCPADGKIETTKQLEKEKKRCQTFFLRQYKYKMQELKQ